MAICKNTHFIVLPALGLFVLITSLGLAVEESITVTTYYPSPYGVYGEMRLYPKLVSEATTCDLSQEGLMFYDRSMHALRVCRCINTSCVLTTDFAYSATNYWTLSASGTNLYPNDPAWNVGIGTTSPGAKLHLTAGSGPQMIFQKSSSFTGNFYHAFKNSAGSDIAYLGFTGGGTDDFVVQNLIPGKMSLWTTGGGLTLDNNGNVGIGTTNPSARLHVQGPGGINAFDVIIGREQAVGDTELRISRTAISNGNMVIDANRYAAGPGNLILQGNVGGGNVGIGTTGPGKKLDVQGGSIRTSDRIGAANYDPDSGYPGGWWGGLHTWDVYAEGSVGVGYSGWANAVIDRYGRGFFANDVQIMGRIGTIGFSPVPPAGLGGGVSTWDCIAYGGLYVLSGGSIRVLFQNNGYGWMSGYLSQGSDVRLKKNVVPLSGALHKMDKIQGVSYERIDGGGNRTIGVIAQDVEKVFPELVSIGPNGYRGVNYSGLTAALVEAVKEQQKQIEELKAEINALKNRRN